MRGKAFAKINLSLRVHGPRRDGLHPIDSTIQSIDWSDEMTLERADDDEFVVTGTELEADERNLAWLGVAAMRSGTRPALRLVLDKQVAVAAGLGGGSADAALGLALGANLLGRSPSDALEAAPGLGADVPFCLAGGLADVTGIGDRVQRRRLVADYAVALVVPPFELATPAVYGRWDALDGPTGPRIDMRDLPPSLRDDAPLVNDLQPAAVAVEPALADWIHDLQRLWGQPVAMSGSGPSLFSLFGSIDEARDAAGSVSGARATLAANPIDRGWEIDESTSLPPAPW